MHRIDGLVVATGTACNHEQLAILRHQRALQRAARPLAGRERIRVAGHQRKIVAPAVQRKAQIPHHDLRAVPAVQAGSKGHSVTLPIHDADVTGVAVMISLAGHAVVVRPVHGNELRVELFRTAFPKLQRRFLRIDQLAALGGVRFGEQAAIRNFDKVHVSEVFFAVGHGELGGFG